MNDIRIHLNLRTSINYLRNLNLFASVPPTNDQHQLTNQIISTRLFLVSLFCSLIILITYTASITIDKTITVEDPSLQRYHELHDQYATTLTCPCSQISVQHNTFLNGKYALHQVCSSDFVTDRWIQYLRRARGTQTLLAYDFRVTSINTFQALTSLCTLAGDTINNSRARFDATSYVTIDLASPIVLKARAQSLIDEFWGSTKNEFLSSLRIVQNATQANALLSAFQSNQGLYLSSGWDGSYHAAKRIS